MWHDIKHCLTNSKYWHIGAKRSVLWLSKICQDVFPTGTPPLTPLMTPLGAYNAPLDPLVGWGGDMHPSIPNSAPRVCGGIVLIFLWKSVPDRHALNMNNAGCRYDVHNRVHCLSVNGHRDSVVLTDIYWRSVNRYIKKINWLWKVCSRQVIFNDHSASQPDDPNSCHEACSLRIPQLHVF